MHISLNEELISYRDQPTMEGSLKGLLTFTQLKGGFILLISHIANKKIHDYWVTVVYQQVFSP